MNKLVCLLCGVQVSEIMSYLQQFEKKMLYQAKLVSRISLQPGLTRIKQCVSCFIYFIWAQSSAADGPRGLSVGDIVTGLEDCPVRGVEDWINCLSHLSHTPQTGYCVPAASLQPSWAHGRRE